MKIVPFPSKPATLTMRERLALAEAEILDLQHHFALAVETMTDEAYDLFRARLDWERRRSSAPSTCCTAVPEAIVLTGGSA